MFWPGSKPNQIFFLKISSLWRMCTLLKFLMCFSFLFKLKLELIFLYTNSLMKFSIQYLNQNLLRKRQWLTLKTKGALTNSKIYTLSLSWFLKKLKLICSLLHLLRSILDHIIMIIIIFSFLFCCPSIGVGFVYCSLSSSFQVGLYLLSFSFCCSFLLFSQSFYCNTIAKFSPLLLLLLVG